MGEHSACHCPIAKYLTTRPNSYVGTLVSIGSMPEQEAATALAANSAASVSPACTHIQYVQLGKAGAVCLQQHDINLVSMFTIRYARV